MKTLLLGALLSIVVAGTSTGATVNFILDLTGPDGTFQIYATSSAGDNAGLMLYGIELSGPIVDLVQLSTAAMDAQNVSGDFGSTGFTVLRLTDNHPDRPWSVVAAQDIFNSTPHLLFGLGQRPGSLAELGISTSGRTTSPAWGQEFLVAAGRFDGDADLVDINLHGVTVANVFTTDGQAFNEIANVTKEIRRRDPVTGLVASTGPLSRPVPVVEPAALEVVPPIVPPAVEQPSIELTPPDLLPAPAAPTEKPALVELPFSTPLERTPAEVLGEMGPGDPPSENVPIVTGWPIARGWLSGELVSCIDYASVDLDGSEVIFQGDLGVQQHTTTVAFSMTNAFDAAPGLLNAHNSPAVPEPSTALLALAAGAALAAPRRRAI